MAYTGMCKPWVPNPQAQGCVMRPAATFVNYACAIKLNNTLYHLLRFLHVRPANRLTIAVVALCR